MAHAGPRAVAQARNLSHLFAGRIAGVSQGALLLERACNSEILEKERSTEQAAGNRSPPGAFPTSEFPGFAVTTAASPAKPGRDPTPNLLF